MTTNTALLRGATAVGALNIRYGIVYIPHLRPVRVMGDRSPSSTTRIRMRSWLSQIIKPEHPGRSRLGPAIIHRKTPGQDLCYAQGGSRGCSKYDDWNILYLISTVRCFV